MRFKILLSCLVIFLSGSKTFAQDENCEITLARAAEEFQGGHFYSIPSILNPCLDKFTPEQQQRANILLTQTYLLLDDPIGARESYLTVLRYNPEFVADENLHPSDVVYLSKKFTTAPIFAWFVRAGSNVSLVRVIHDLDVFDNRAEEQYTLKPGYQASFGGDYYFKEKMGIRAELQYTFTSYQHSTRNFFQDDTKEFIDKQTWLSFPVTFLYGDPDGIYRPYAYAGFSPWYLVRDIASGSIEKVRTIEDERDDQQSPDWNFMYKRNRMNYSILAGGGIKIKIGLQFIFVDARYSLGLKNVVNPKNLYVNNDLPLTGDEFVTTNSPTASFAHVDDYFRLDNLSLSFGYLRPLYKPRDLKKESKRTFIGRIINRKNEKTPK